MKKEVVMIREGREKVRVKCTKGENATFKNLINIEL